MRAPIGTFTDVHPAVEKLDLLPAPVAAALTAWSGQVPVEELLLVDTDPEKADTAVFTETYGVALEQSANCVVVAGKRGGR